MVGQKLTHRIHHKATVGIQPNLPFIRMRLLCRGVIVFLAQGHWRAQFIVIARYDVLDGAPIQFGRRQGSLFSDGGSVKQMRPIDASLI